jgi:hypothetical protein
LIKIITNNLLYNSHKKDLKPETLDEIINTLVKGLDILENELKKVLSDKLTNEIRIKYLNTLKMITFLIIEFTTHVEKIQMGSKENELMPMTNKVCAVALL